MIFFFLCVFLLFSIVLLIIVCCINSGNDAYERAISDEEQMNYLKEWHQKHTRAS